MPPTCRATAATTVCLDLSPAHGGMYRGVADVARLVGSPIVSFRDGSGRLPPDVPDLSVTTIDCSGLPTLAWSFGLPASTMRAAIEALRDTDFIIAHSLFRGHVAAVRRVAEDRGVPYVVVPHGALEPALWRRGRIARRAWMAAQGTAYLRGAACVVFATTAEREHAAETLGWMPRSMVIPFPVPPATPPSAGARQSARAALGLPEDARILLMLGRLDSVKRPREAMRWFLEADAPGLHLAVAGGDGDVTAAELARLIPAGRRGSVSLLGHLDAARKPLAIAAADGYLSWSRHESFGYAAAECMAAGLPIILPPGHDLRSDVASTGCGLFPREDDREAFIEAVRTFARQPAAELSRAGNAARTWAASRLDPVTVGAAWATLVESLSGEPGGPASPPDGIRK